MLPADLAKIYGVRWSEAESPAKASPQQEAGDAATKS
jgi:hypothetical protein